MPRVFIEGFKETSLKISDFLYNWDQLNYIEPPLNHVEQITFTVH